MIKKRKQYTELASDISLERITVEPLKRNLTRKNDDLETKKTSLASLQRTLSELNTQHDVLEQKLIEIEEK